MASINLDKLLLIVICAFVCYVSWEVRVEEDSIGENGDMMVSSI